MLTETRAFGTPLAETYATNTWTPNGKLLTVTDADGSSHTTTYSYGGFDEPLATSFADATSEQQSYFVGITLCSADVQPCAKVNRSGQTFTYGYDPLNRLISKTVPAAGSIPANTVTTVYDLQNRVTNVSDTNGNTIATTYDTASRKLSETRTTPTLSAKTVSYAYDNGAGDKVDRSRLTWPDGYYVNYSFDALGHPTTVIDSGGTTLATYSYDDLARRASLQYSGTAGAKMLYSWSAENDLLTLQSDFAGTANDVAFTNQFNPAHQWANVTTSNAAFRYAPGGNASVSYASNALNQYTTLNGSLAIAYDGNGNYRGALPNPPLAYDAENRLMTIAALSVAYAYDPNGRRTAKTVGGTVTNYVHDGDSEIAEYSGTGAGTLLRRFVPGPAIDDYIAMVTAAGTKTFFHTDKMGSVIAMSDTSGNMVEGPYIYDGYGLCLAGGAACNAGVPFRFTGQRLDPETNLYYYRARIYAPALGRFLQTDPIGYMDDLDAYTYVGDDPTDRTDPSGAGPIGWIVKLTEKGLILIKPLFEKSAAVAARRAEKNVVSTEGRQAAGEIERAAAGNANDVMRHPGHDLGDGVKGEPHFQTEGKGGHTFYDAGAIIAGTIAVLEVIDQLDPWHIQEAGCNPDIEKCEGHPEPHAQHVSRSPNTSQSNNNGNKKKGSSNGGDQQKPHTCTGSRIPTVKPCDSF